MKRPASKQGRPAGRTRAVWLLVSLSVAYLFAWAASALAALGLARLGQAPSEAVLSSAIAAFVLYPPLVLWLLCARQALRHLVGLTGLSLALLLAQQVLKGAG